MTTSSAASLPPIRVDLRSDTVTRPTAAMRAAMAAATVGDDVYGEDPTVNALESRAAQLSGKEAALFVASGSMGNLVSVLAHVPRGGEVILPSQSHILDDEAASYAVVASAGVRPVQEGADGQMPVASVLAAIQDPDDAHSAVTSLVVVENCHAHSMSRPIPPQYLGDLRAALPDHLPIHVDGARLFNAAVALGVPISMLLEHADSAMFCLSKGLAAPVGSMVVGSAAFISRARRARKLVGGGMRQAGIIAAAGLVALADDEHGTVARLADDHRRARELAVGLAAQSGVISPGGRAQPDEGPLDPSRVATNFVLYTVEGGLDRRRRYVEQMRERGIAVMEYNDGQVRAVTHRDIDDAAIVATLQASQEALAASV